MENLIPDDSTSNASTSNNNKIVVISDTYTIKTSRTYLKKHTLLYLNSPLNEAQTEWFRPITKEDIDNSIMDMVIATGVSFNILNNPSFYILAKTSGQILLTYDGWHSTVHKSHYIVITGSWISDDWRIVNIVLSFQKSGQTVKEIISEIMNTLKNYSIKKKLFALTMDNTTTNKAGLKEISILHKNVHKVMKYLANPLASNRIEVLESHCRISRINFLKPILKIDTRWNSTLAMFERYLHLHPAIKEMCSKEPSMPTCLAMKA
ncbi:14546_t:CDS:2 [Dentiscutata erythropus]|uniref:14546_t:CDS:1 n=1 Tax=Dentiscutata erythropus TaxID=1348616 RepID=A0A9N9ELB7_9GLOM|nr:14546_t:CDS:2 [Dentiscutata erythropus]